MSLFKKKAKKTDISVNENSGLNVEDINDKEQDYNPQKYMELQEKFLAEINDLGTQLNLKILNNQITREEYLANKRAICKAEGLRDDEITDMLELLDNMVFGYGILQNLLVDPANAKKMDIRLTSPDRIAYREKGKWYLSTIKFNNVDEYNKFVNSLTERNKTILSYADATQVFSDNVMCPTHILRFSIDKSIVNGTNLDSVLIRKIPKETPSWEELIADGLFTEDQKNILCALWGAGFSILVAGPNGCGKTTIMNKIINSATPKDKSCCIIQESNGEIHSDPKEYPHIIYKRIVPKKANTEVFYDLAAITKMAVKQSFDIIIVGEITGGEAAQLAGAVYTGSQSMTSTHSISVADAKKRIVQLACDANPNRKPEFFMEQLKGFRVTVYAEGYKIRDINVDGKPFSWETFNAGGYGNPKDVPEAN